MNTDTNVQLTIRYVYLNAHDTNHSWLYVYDTNMLLYVAMGGSLVPVPVLCLKSIIGCIQSNFHFHHLTHSMHLTASVHAYLVLYFFFNVDK